MGDGRRRAAFWIADRIIDEFAPVMGRYPFGAAALAVYAVLARRADRERDSWPSLALIAEASGSGERTVQKALRLLELLGLVEISTCYDQGTRRQTSNLYTLLTPPDQLPEIDPDPRKWTAPQRRTVLVRGSNRSNAVVAARPEQRGSAGERPASVGLGPVPEAATPRTLCTLPPATNAPPHRKPCTLPPAERAPLEGNTVKDNTVKEGALRREIIDATFTIEEIGLTSRQVWAATLGELARGSEVGRTELESWLRPAALIGRDGKMLIIGAPNAVSRERIATRLLPAVREALAATMGAPVEVSVVVDRE